MAACALHGFPEDHGSLKLEGVGGQGQPSEQGKQGAVSEDHRRLKLEGGGSR